MRRKTLSALLGSSCFCLYDSATEGEACEAAGFPAQHRYACSVDCCKAEQMAAVKLQLHTLLPSSGKTFVPETSYR